MHPLVSNQTPRQQHCSFSHTKKFISNQDKEEWKTFFLFLFIIEVINSCASFLSIKQLNSKKFKEKLKFNKKKYRETSSFHFAYFSLSFHFVASHRKSFFFLHFILSVLRIYEILSVQPATTTSQLYVAWILFSYIFYCCCCLLCRHRHFLLCYYVSYVLILLYSAWIFSLQLNGMMEERKIILFFQQKQRICSNWEEWKKNESHWNNGAKIKFTFLRWTKIKNKKYRFQQFWISWRANED